MSYFNISDDNDNEKSYILTSYKITKQKDCVLVKLDSNNYSITYELRPDVRFNTVDKIKNFIEKLLSKVVTNEYTLEISEYFERMYVIICHASNYNSLLPQFCRRLIPTFYFLSLPQCAVSYRALFPCILPLLLLH